MNEPGTIGKFTHNFKAEETENPHYARGIPECGFVTVPVMYVRQPQKEVDCPDCPKIKFVQLELFDENLEPAI